MEPDADNKNPPSEAMQGTEVFLKNWWGPIIRGKTLDYKTVNREREIF